MENKKQTAYLMFFGTVALLVGLLVALLFPSVITSFVHKKITLIPSNLGFPIWRDLDLPIYQNFYIFNVKNPDQILNGAKPILEELGPFVFRANISKSSLRFVNGNKDLSFWEKKTFHYQEALSPIAINTTVTTLNVPLVMAYRLINSGSVPPIMSKIVNYLIKNVWKKSLFIESTVEELLFKGKYNQIACIAHLINPNLEPSCDFSYLYGQNQSMDGLYLIGTGTDDIRNLNIIQKYNGSDKLNFWSGDDCNRVDGASNGELFPPLDVVPDKRLKFFRSDFCRVFNLTLSEANVVGGVGNLRVDRFRLDPTSLQNVTLNPRNACYQPKNSETKKGFKPIDDSVNFQTLTREFWNNSVEDLLKLLKPNPKFQLPQSEEKPSGVFDLSACHQGVPIYISYPHFLEADPIFLTQVIGLHPNKSIHESYIDIEPVTGSPVDFLARIQVNIELNAQSSNEPKVRSMMFPSLWQEFSIHITERMAYTITSSTRPYIIGAYSITALIFVTGLVLLLYAIMLIVMHWHQNRSAQQTMINNDQEPLVNENGYGDDSNNNNIIK